MAYLVDLADIPPIGVWDKVRARRVQGDKMTLAIVELEPGGVVPTHVHPNEQIGMVLHGRVSFHVGSEARTLGPGGTWCIRGDVPHSVVAGPEGAVVVDAFAPVRDDWDALKTLAPSAPRWPAA